MDKFVKFGLVGVFNTLIQIIIFNMLRVCNFNVVVANSIGYICGMVNSYLWNNRWVFKSNSKEAITIFKFIIVNLITMIINNLLLLILVGKLGLNDTISQIIAIIFTMIINFIGNKLWTFKSK
ncbi:GtrA family protein [Clostridium sp.]|uniref:GtrA family protein n=1 Tax=Clostridium sp. TaxID=1506 RepID=UPI0025BCF3F3|nr:GtrA family protein [Clostridium sp.]